MRVTAIWTGPPGCNHVRVTLDLDGAAVTVEGLRADFASGSIWQQSNNDPKQALGLAWLRYKLTQGLTLEQLMQTEMIMRAISQYVLSDAATQVWTNMPAALTEFRAVASQPHRMKADLTAAVEARIVVRVTTVGSANAQLRVQYSTDETTWVYLDGVDGPKVGISAGGARDSAWVSLVAGAKADVALRVIGINGDGVADPAFGMIQMQVR